MVRTHTYFNRSTRNLEALINFRGPNRSDWPEVLFRIYVDKTMGAKDKVEVWYCNDKLILDSDHHAMRVFDIPATISSQIEDFILMAMMHSDSRMKIFDIRGRMPNVARIAGKNGEKQENLKSLNGLSMMMTRFRLKAALLPRERRSGSREIEEGLKALLPPSCFRSSPPSTKSFGRLLTDEEVTKLQALNKGKFDYRKRGACGVSIATIPEDKKSSHDKKRDMALQEFDQLLSEVEDVIESMPRKKESRNGKEPESLSSQDEGRPFNQWDGEDTTAESLAPWNTFNSNILDPDLLGLFPEIAAVTDEKHAFPEDRPEPNLSESFRSNTGIIVHGFPHTCSKPSQWNSHNRVQSSADWIEHNMQISRVQGGLIESQSALEWRTEAESMTGFRFFAGMTGTEQQGNMLCSGIQSPSFSQPLYDFPTGQDELLEKTTATSNGIGTYPDPGEGFSIKPDAVNSNVEGDAHLHQVSDIFELFGDDITNPHYNFPNSGESDHGLPAGEETLGSLHLDVNNRDGTLTQLAYTPDTEWTLDNFTNPF